MVAPVSSRATAPHHRPCSSSATKMPPHSRGRSGSGCIGSVVRFWQGTYAPDYTGLALLVAGYIVLQLAIEPFHRMFALNDTSIQYPHAVVERVPVLWLMIYTVALPLIFLAVWFVVLRPGAHKIHVSFLGLLIGIVLTVFVTDTVKNLVGRPRPDLISRCKPKSDTPKTSLVTFEVCTETNHHVLHDGWRSFPSGHSSLSFSGLGYLSIFLCGQLRIFHEGTDLVKGIAALAPLIGALYIATSRLEDYRHDFYDVTIGSILGYSIALLSYRRYYPRLRSSMCDEPSPSRAALAEKAGFAKIKSDEETGQGGRFSIGDPEDDPDAIPLSSAYRNNEIAGQRAQAA